MGDGARKTGREGGVRGASGDFVGVIRKRGPHGAEVEKGDGFPL